ncbi:MAG: hypothetical protein M1814_001592 [Vezdaea aestivalis]|nr:MAG: hypothetical protein M1814_001592 [Vezdaea aestivalis]
MPERNLTVATYAAGASLAAITLVYVFGPTFFIDGDSSVSMSARKKGVVGLSNPANDCFINSILQSLAGLGDLRIYLIRESHRRRLDGGEVYRASAEEGRKLSKVGVSKLEGLQMGIVTVGLKEVLDSLNERPIYRKTISASGFVKELEVAFRQRISRQQQDAQEFLQIVAERLCDEYHAGKKARRKWRERERPSGEPKEEKEQKTSVPENDEEGGRGPDMTPVSNGVEKINSESATAKSTETTDEAVSEDEDGFPLDGRHESQVECLTCHFKPKSSESSFVTLTLNVPKRNATTLNDCFDGLFKSETIEDYVCDRCRLEHAIETYARRQRLIRDEKELHKISEDLKKLEEAIETDPEKLPEGVKIPDSKLVPKRKISRNVKITKYPKVLAIHLSRSIFDPRFTSTKNSCKVSFPEQLSLGGILHPRSYKLLGLVTHKGSHNSGHYESFRRQNLYPPFSTPNVFHPGGAYSQLPPPSTSQAVSPSLKTQEPSKLSRTNLGPSRPSTSSSTPPSSAPDLAIPSSPQPAQKRTSRSSLDAPEHGKLTNRPLSAASSASRVTGATSTTSSSTRTNATTGGEKSSIVDLARGTKRRKRPNDRWWRISDEKAKECKTVDVLGMQREVYLLFYELERE